MDWHKDADSFKDANGYEIDGEWYPRVTKIVGIKSKPALYFYYAAAKNYSEAQRQTQASAAEGTLIHEIAEKILIGENPDVPESVKPAINAFKDFVDNNSVVVDAVNVEKRVFNPEHRYAGTIDALALLDGKFGVLDIKTSQDFYRDYNLQTSAYMDALVRDPLLQGLNTRWILRIDQIKNCLKCSATLRPKGGRDKVRNSKNGSSACPDGEHEWSELQGVVAIKETPYWENDFEAFLAAKRLWEWENEYWLKRVGYL